MRCVRGGMLGFGLREENSLSISSYACAMTFRYYTECAHRKWKETKQQPGTAGPGYMLGCCLVSFHFLWSIHPIRPVESERQTKRQHGRISSLIPLHSDGVLESAIIHFFKTARYYGVTCPIHI